MLRSNRRQRLLTATAADLKGTAQDKQGQAQHYEFSHGWFCKGV
jgi:hypothetical protein